MEERFQRTPDGIDPVWEEENIASPAPYESKKELSPEDEKHKLVEALMMNAKQLRPYDSDAALEAILEYPLSESMVQRWLHRVIRHEDDTLAQVLTLKVKKYTVAQIADELKISVEEVLRKEYRLVNLCRRPSPLKRVKQIKDFYT